MTVQPTEQWVHTVLTFFAAPAPAVCASALCIMPPPRLNAAVTPLAARPERRKKVRRSMAPPESGGISVENRVVPAVPFVLLTSMISLPPAQNLAVS
jgi:hypothetical protein